MRMGSFLALSSFNNRSRCEWTYGGVHREWAIRGMWQDEGSSVSDPKEVLKAYRKWEKDGHL